MAKYDRVTGKVFAETASGLGNNPEIGQFGSAKTGEYIGTNDINEIQANAEAWSKGWTSAVVNSMNYPPLPEMNGVLKVLSYQICAMLQQGVSFWDKNTDYYIDNITNYNGKLFKSLIDGNTTEPLTDEGASAWEDILVTNLPVATLFSNGACRPDGVTLGISPDGVLSLLQQPIIDIVHPIGDPLICLNNRLSTNEVWLNGALVGQSIYPQLYDIYGYTYTYNTDRYELTSDLTVTGEPEYDENFLYIADNDNHLSFSRVFDPTQAWEMNMKVRTPRAELISVNGNLPLICGHTDNNANFNGIHLLFQDDMKVHVSLSSNNSSWNIANNQSTEQVFEYKTWYWVKFSYDGNGTYSLKLSTNGSDYTEYWTLGEQDAIKFNADHAGEELGIGWNNGGGTYNNSGNGSAIDLSECSLSQNGEIVQQALAEKADYTNFRLPNFTGRALWGANDYGYIEAGIPDHRHTVTGASQRSYDGSGATSAQPAQRDTSYASQYNLIYGNSDTVQPPAIKLRVKTRYQ